MNLVSLLLLIQFGLAQDPKIRKIADLNPAEVFNSIDYFKQHHTNTFKVNLFRRSMKENGPDGLRQASYIVGIVKYSGDEAPQVFEIGNFQSPRIAGVVRQNSALKLTIDHELDNRKRSSTYLITKEGVTEGE